MRGLSIYRARYRRWRAERGSVEWHRATAAIRKHSGDDLGAFVHRVVASVKEKIRGLLKVIDSLVECHIRGEVGA